MKKQVFSMRDSIAEIYLPPFMMRTIGEATRATLNSSKDPQTYLHQSPNDYVLYQIATFDDLTGEYEMLEDKKKIGSVAEMQAIANYEREDAVNLKKHQDETKQEIE